MKKILFSIFIFFIAFFYAQNTHILDNNGTILQDNISYCEGQNFNLKINANSINTGDYKIEEISGNFQNGNMPVTFTHKRNDNFSQPISIPFRFQFYGKEYEKVVVGSNGRLIFGQGSEFENLHQNQGKDIFHPNTKLNSNIFNQLSQSNNLPLNFAQIFAGFTNIGYYNPNDFNEIRFSNTNYQGNRALLISFNGVLELNSNYSIKFSSQILLLDNHSFIIKVTKNRTSQNAILGIQNETATKYKVPSENYNNDKWTNDGSKAFLFTPNQQLTPKISWFINDTEQVSWANQQTINYTPNGNTKLGIKISYFDNDNQQVGQTEESFINFKKIEKVQVQSIANTGCAAGNTLSIQQPTQNTEYQWYKDGQLVGEGTNLVANTTGTYYAMVKGCNASRSDDISVTITSNIPAIPFEEGKIFYDCDKNGNQSKVIDLQNIINYPNGNYRIEFFDANGNSINKNVSISSGRTENFKVKISDNSGCSVEKNFKVSYQSLPNESTIFSTRKLCQDLENYSIDDLYRDLNFDRNFNIKFSTDGINFNLDNVNPKLHQNIRFKISMNNFSCVGIYQLKFDFHESIEIKPITQFPEHCFSSTEYFDLNRTKQELEYHSDILATFYTDENLTQRINNLNFRGSGIIYIKVENTRTQCVAPEIIKLELKIYRKPTLIKTTPETKTAHCGTSIYDLTTNINDYVSNWTKDKEILYFDASGNQLSQSEWQNYDASVKGNRPYILLIFNSTRNMECSDKIEFNLIKNEKPTSKISSISVCGINTFSLSEFKNRVGNEFIILDENRNEISQNFSWTNLPFQVKFYLKNRETGCISDLQTLNFVQGNPVDINSNIPIFTQCDTDNDGITNFNLNNWKSNISNDNNVNIEFFEDSNRTIKITNPTAYINRNRQQTIYGTAKSDNLCPTDFQFDIKVNIPTDIQGIEDLFPCYGESVSQMVMNASDFTNIRWIFPNGEEQIGNQLTLQYTDIQFGTYKIIATNTDGCTSETTFAISDSKQLKINKINTSNNQIEVIANGSTPPYEYSFDGGITWQTSNILHQPTQPTYNIVVRSGTCQSEPKSVYFFNFYNTITPNGDGKNDVWKVENLDKMQNVSIIITDRYGKTIFMTQDATKHWDGTERGRKLPTATYWYIVKWIDPNTQNNEVRQGWILLKNY